MLKSPYIPFGGKYPLNCEATTSFHLSIFQLSSGLPCLQWPLPFQRLQYVFSRLLAAIKMLKVVITTVDPQMTFI